MPLDRLSVHAASSYSTAGAVITNNGSVGCIPTYNGVGDSTLTLDRALNNADMCLLAHIRGATIGSVRYVNTSDTAKQLLCRNETGGGLAAAERAIDVSLIKISAIDRRFIHAAGHYQGSAAGAAVAFGQRGGIVARTGAGVYTITLDRDLDQRECAVIVTVGVGAGAATDVHARVTHTSDTVKTVTLETLAAGADIDADFCWAVFNMNASQGSGRALGVGSIDAAGGNPVGRGCLPARNGAGDYRYGTDRNAGSGEYTAHATVIGATGGATRIVDALTGRKDVETQVQAAAAQTDLDHALVMLRLI